MITPVYLLAQYIFATNRTNSQKHKYSSLKLRMIESACHDLKVYEMHYKFISKQIISWYVYCFRITKLTSQTFDQALISGASLGVKAYKWKRLIFRCCLCFRLFKSVLRRSRRYDFQYYFIIMHSIATSYNYSFCVTTPV